MPRARYEEAASEEKVSTGDYNVSLACAMTMLAAQIIGAFAAMAFIPQRS